MPRTSRAGVGMLLDDFMPVYDFNEVHTIVVQASADIVFRTIRKATAAETPLTLTLLGIRSMPARLVGQSGLRFVSSRPLLEQMLSAGFVLLGEAPNREIVLGTIGQFWKLRGASVPKISNAEEFLEFDRPGYAKAAMNFHVDENNGDGNAIVSTETRICLTDPIARRKFAAYWRLIHPWSALSRREWLRAIKLGAEKLENSSLG